MGVSVRVCAVIYVLVVCERLPQSCPPLTSLAIDRGELAHATTRVSFDCVASWP
jgi:hypothetical protein